MRQCSICGRWINPRAGQVFVEYMPRRHEGITLPHIVICRTCAEVVAHQFSKTPDVVVNPAGAQP